MLLATRVEQPQFDQAKPTPSGIDKTMAPEGIAASTVAPLIDPPKENI
jgi:hypothetical protein